MSMTRLPRSTFWLSFGVIFLIAAVALASPGDLDTGFGNGGVVIEDLGPNDGNGMAGVVDTQGRVLALGRYDDGTDWDFVVYRYLPNGDLDTNWGQGGVARIDVNGLDNASDLALTPDGKVVIIGTSGPTVASQEMAIVRLTDSGALDTEFSSDGKLLVVFAGRASGQDVTVAPDGRIFAVGTANIGSGSDISVAVVKPDGQLDTSFGGDGRTTLDLGGTEFGRAVTVTSDGAVVVGGESDDALALAVLQPSGDPDPGFSGDGVTIFSAGPFEGAGAVEEDGSAGLVVAGSSFTTEFEFVVLRYNRNGTLDAGFGDQGAARVPLGDALSSFGDLAIAPTGHIVLTGYTGESPNRNVVVARLGANGGLDSGFGQGGITTTDAGGDDFGRGIAVGKDGSIFAFGDTNTAGTRDLLIVKYEGTPPPDEPDPDPGLVCTDAFGDDEGHIFEDDINCIAAADITRGCNPPVNDRFCPDSTVTRGQMAAFLARALKLTPSDQGFTDTQGHVFEDDVAALATAGITRGCNPPDNDRFCPNDNVTRGQMAAFLARALKLTPSDQGFTDTQGHVFEDDVAALAAAGITRGCNPPDNTRFCPDDPVTRGQMAAFLNRALLDG